MPSEQSIAVETKVINDFSITVGTVNGSGSQTSNLTLLRALFKMGIPVSGKNLFPSNIQGLPTWYTIRVSGDGYLARSATTEVIVAMNPTTFAEDLASLVPGGVFFYADHIKLKIDRTDVSVYPLPVRQIVKAAEVPSSLRDYVANMVYVGVVAQILNIDLEKIHQALDFHFKGKAKPIELNFNIIQAAADWAAANLTKTDPYQAEPMDATNGYIMADGNTAGALGAIYGGVQFTAWYPITPASSLPEALIEHLPKLRKDPETGKHTYAVVQAEDELAAIGMIVGAGWGGLRAMTSTSGPGISLMGEFSSLAYFAEVPFVIWNIQRMGPSTGLPTRTSQGDVNLCYYLGQGDTKHIVLLPGSVTECFEFGWKSFDLAEKLQTPVFVLSDLDFGMNQWMTKPFEYPQIPMDRGKILWEDDLKQLTERWGRYRDVDGDGIPYRTLMGNQHPQSAYFARGTGHDDYANYTEDPEIWDANMHRLDRKFATARTMMPAPEIQTMANAEIGIIAYGSTDPAVQETRDRLTAVGYPTDYLRLKALPLKAEVLDFVASHDRTYVVEMNRDGQVHSIISLEIPECVGSLVSMTQNNGLPITAEWLECEILSEENKQDD
jgi:2-oxoglutarate/2-oxoacid ferredoxin oxidoreductase subunit alpha